MRFDVETVSPVWDHSFAGFVRIGFDGVERKDIYALPAPSGVYNTYHRYCLKTGQGWADLGTTPTLSYDADSDSIASYYDLHDGTLSLLRTETIKGD